MQPLKIETIAALATPVGRSALAVIRVSGPDSFEKVSSLIARLGEASPIPPVRQMVFGRLFADSEKSRFLDEVMFCRYEAPASYTGEDLVEIFSHGNPVVVREILTALGRLGIRLAQPGEFTRRAFLNGKMDLIQAEAVSQLISARSQRALQAVRSHLDGRFSQRLHDVRERLIAVLGWLEADLDFGDREVDDVVAIEPLDLEAQLAVIAQEVRDILGSVQTRKAFRDGLLVVLAGRPNVGKSSLLNALSGSDRALVDDQPGTTRDYLETWLDLGGLSCRLVDTAGLRPQAKGLEALGTEKSTQLLEQADLILAVFSGAEAFSEEDRAFFETLAAPRVTAPILNLVNKADLPRQLSEMEAELRSFDKRNLGSRAVSAKTGQGIDALVGDLGEQLRGIAGLEEGAGEESVALLTVRQVGILETVGACLTRAAATLTEKRTLDCLSLDLRQALSGLSQLLGSDFVAEDPNVEVETILDRVFETFCIGK